MQKRMYSNGGHYMDKSDDYKTMCLMELEIHKELKYNITVAYKLEEQG